LDSDVVLVCGDDASALTIDALTGGAAGQRRWAGNERAATVWSSIGVAHRALPAPDALELRDIQRRLEVAFRTVDIGFGTADRSYSVWHCQEWVGRLQALERIAAESSQLTIWLVDAQSLAPQWRIVAHALAHTEHRSVRVIER
jgi:hypothetical protein